MDREYLEDYAQKENEEYKKLLKDIEEGKFSFEKDKHPPDKRFIKLQKPVSITSFGTSRGNNLWTQIPFCGSSILTIPPIKQSDFERIFFKISEIPKVIDFIKETGKLQISLSANVYVYEGLNYLAPFFKELNPPHLVGIPVEFYGNKKEIQKATSAFSTLGRIRFFDFLREGCQKLHSNAFSVIHDNSCGVYMTLKLGHYQIVEDIENLMIDNPEKAFLLFRICKMFIVDPVNTMRCDMFNYTLEETRRCHIIPRIYQPEEIRFPSEIGKFLLKRLTNAPLGIRACYDIIDHYEGYDLKKVQESLNDGIVANNPDIIERSTKEFDEILENVWNDPAVSKRIKNLRRGVPMSIAAIGSGLSALTGSWEGFLAGLGFSVGSAFLKAEIEGLSEKLAKFFSRSYQANIYDFKEKYKHRIIKE